MSDDDYRAEVERIKASPYMSLAPRPMTPTEQAALDAMPDPIEREYLLLIKQARSADEAYELTIGLRQYREMFKDVS